MTTERIKIELSEDQVTFLGRLRNLSASEFIVGLVDRAMREEWVINHGGGRVGAHNWEGLVADPSPRTRRLMEQVAGPIKLTLRPDVPAEWTDEITAEIQRRGLDNPLDVCRELIREGLDRAGSGAADSAVAGTMSPTEIAELQRWYRAHIAGRMVGGEGEPGADVPLERLYDEEIADADPVDLALMKAFYEGTLRPVPITPEEQERLIAELDAVAANTPGTPTRWM